jgi:hypothetical protein
MGMVGALMGFIALAFPAPAIAIPPGLGTCGGLRFTVDNVTQLGCFTVGDANAGYIGSVGGGQHVNFWGNQWAKNNTVSGGSAPNSFKGWAQNVTPNGPCDGGFTLGGTFTSRTGNSSDPPATIPSIIQVLVVDHVWQDGPVIRGHYRNIANVLVDPGYGPNPGHPGTGVVIGEQCDEA